jgi:hypothetical protein
VRNLILLATLPLVFDIFFAWCLAETGRSARVAQPAAVVTGPGAAAPESALLGANGSSATAHRNKAPAHRTG